LRQEARNDPAIAGFLLFALEDGILKQDGIRRRCGLRIGKIDAKRITTVCPGF
jgi:hypothetical protein